MEIADLKVTLHIYYRLLTLSWTVGTLNVNKKDSRDNLVTCCRARNERELGREPRDAWDREGRPGDRDGRPGGGEIGGGPPGKFAFRRDQEEDHRLRGVDDRRSYYQHDMRDGRGGGGGNLSDRRMMGGGVAGRGRLMGGSGGFGGGGMKRIRQEMEPEWASESVSLSDTIELR